MMTLFDRLMCWLTGHQPMQVTPRDPEGLRVPHRLEIHCFRCGKRLDNGSVLFAPIAKGIAVVEPDDDDVAEANAQR